MKQILIIQTSFLGDVILATSLVETLNKAYGENCIIDILVRKGNESLLENNPKINKVYIWRKKEKKYRQLFRVIKQLRKQRYTSVYNVHRSASTGFITWRLKANEKIGFQKNPLSFTYTKKISHQIGDGRHEIERNFELIKHDLPKEITTPLKPRLYPSSSDSNKVEGLLSEKKQEFYVFAPASVWFTKQLPKSKWIELVKIQEKKYPIYLIGAPSDAPFIDEIIEKSKSEKCINLAGKLSLLQSADLISKAKRTYVNDSAPLHLASSMNAPVTVFFCSTIPTFGFGPLSDDSIIKEVNKTLDCRPCGLHGFKVCPNNNFICGKDIDL